MNRLADNVVDAGIEQRERCIEGRLVGNGDDRCSGTIADGARQIAGVPGLADEEGFDGADIGIGCGIDPLAELDGIEACRGDALAAEQGCVTFRYELSLINHDDHSPISESAAFMC
ncbi:hypothetical protein GCM10010924_25550 [Rhizobium wenxiniae]|nr:hypothetical protein GCM10010924_25550 [Rhizobium wenxiniae]